MLNPSTALEETAGGTRATRRRKARAHISATIAVAVIAAALSITSFILFFGAGMTNVYGDGVAHVNIARKVVDSPDDSFRQRYIQIGSPWLPLQTVLMLPLVSNEWMWRTGTAGSLVSMITFIIATTSLYLLSRSFYRNTDEPRRRILPALTAAIFALNPSALYMQSTPMTELVFMASLVSSVFFLQRWFEEQSSSRLVIAGAVMSLATLARYEAWPVAALSAVIVLVGSRKVKQTLLFASLVSIGPLYWLWHNWLIYGNALEFLTGPNSARGIYLQNQANLGWSRIFVGHAVLDFFTVVIAAAVCAGPVVLLLGVLGLGRSLVVNRARLVEVAPALLLIVPLFFHAFSLYRGEIQIFPFSAFGLHNVRYGLPHLLAVSLFAPGVVLMFKAPVRRWAAIGICVVVAVQYFYVISEGPAQLAVYQEGYRNGVNAKPARDRSKVASFLLANPPDGLVLMHSGALGPVVSQGGLYFSRTIHEGTARWHQINAEIPSDVSTVILQENDALDLRLKQNQSLADALSKDFEEKLSVGQIRILERRENRADLSR